jgi:putative heme transporter
MTAHDQRDRRRFRMRLPGLAVTVGCVAGLAWLVADQHDQLGRAIAVMGRANPGLIVAAVACEWVSMVSFARMQRRLLLAGGEHLAIVSAVGIAFAGNAVSVSVPVAGSGLGTAFTYRQFRRHRVSDAAAALALLVSGVLSTLTLMAVMAAGALMSGNTVAGALGALWATACVAGMAGLVLGLRKPAFRRLLERMAVGAVRTVQRLRHAPGQPEAVVARTLTRLGGVRYRRRDWAVAAGMASLNWLGDAACLVLSLTAARLAVSLRDVLLVWSAGVAASILYLTPGGVGIVDVALVAALAGLRVPAAHAVVGVLIYRLISLWLVLLTGWILFFLIGFRRPGFRRPGQALMRAEHPPVPARRAPRLPMTCGILRPRACVRHADRGGEHHAQLVPGPPVAPRLRRHDVAHDLNDNPQEVNSDA